MPLSAHYHGHGDAVMRAMKKEYGARKAERIFYATEQKLNAKKKPCSMCDTLAHHMQRGAFRKGARHA